MATELTDDLTLPMPGEPASTARRRRPMRSFDEPAGAGRVSRYALLCIVTFLVVFPIYTTVVAALKPGSEVLRNPLVPTTVTFDVLIEAWNEGHLGRYLFNSFVVAAVVTTAQVSTSVLAAYAFAFLEFPGKRIVFLVFVATMLVPAEATLVVNLDTVDGLGWLNTYQGLAVPFLATAFGIFLLRQVFLTLPRICATQLRSTGSVTSGSSVTLPSHSFVRRSERSRCSVSSPPGTSTCGRTW